MEVTLDLGPAERESNYYQYVPFSAGRDWPSVAVQVVYDRSEAVIDLGLMGPGGFRGWSGGARGSAHVAEP